MLFSLPAEARLFSLETAYSRKEVMTREILFHFIASVQTFVTN